MAILMTVVALIGALTIFFFLLYTGYSIITGIRTHFQPSQVPLTTRFGKWAIVTGCTDGIGRAYAFELAKRGLNIVLISRTPSKLEQVAKEIESLHLVETKQIAVDFSDVTKALPKVEEAIKNLPIGILVNNVGKQYDYPMYLSEVPDKDLWDIININIGAVTLMTKLVLPRMAEERRGAIVNVSSSSEAQPLPLMTVYAASKVYIKSFSAALRLEYGKQGITIQHLSPMFVGTKMNHFSTRIYDPSFFVPDAKTYAESAVNTLGRVNQSTGYWSHGIQAFFISLSPVPFRSYISLHMNKLFRQDYFNKLTEKQTDHKH